MKDRHKFQFEMSTKHPENWEISSSKLYRAAKILEKTYMEDFGDIDDIEAFLSDEGPFSPQVGSVSMMLYGLSIENLLKAILVKEQGAFDENQNFKHASHFLVKLVEKIGNFELDEKELSVLKTLEEYIIWSGKYPAPLKEITLSPEKSGFSGYTISSSDFDVIRNMILKFRRYLDA